jgi:hypothetical protein
MKLNLLLKIIIGISLVAGTIANAQSTGNLTFTFTIASHSPCYQQNKHALAAWIQTSSGTFVKTKLRYAGSGGGTQDHLPTFAVKAGGSANNCLGGNVNVVSATTGATRTSFTSYTFTWDGTNAAGALVADGNYSVAIELTWNHGSSTTVKTYSFIKGSTADVQSPANNTDFTNVSLNWTPTNVGIGDVSQSDNEVSIFPNPNSTGMFTVNFNKAKAIKVYNTIGDLMYSEKVLNNVNNVSIDLSNLQNGVYFFVVSDDEKNVTRKVIINK